MLVLGKHALITKLGIYLFVRRLDKFIFVTIHVEKWLWILPTSFWSVQYQGTVSIDYFWQEIVMIHVKAVYVKAHGLSHGKDSLLSITTCLIAFKSPASSYSYTTRNSDYTEE